MQNQSCFGGRLIVAPLVHLLLIPSTPMHLKLINNPFCYLTDQIIIRELQLKSCHTLIKKCCFNFFEQCNFCHSLKKPRHFMQIKQRYFPFLEVHMWIWAVSVSLLMHNLAIIMLNCRNVIIGYNQYLVFGPIKFFWSHQNRGYSSTCSTKPLNAIWQLRAGCHVYFTDKAVTRLKRYSNLLPLLQVQPVDLSLIQMYQ